MKTGCAIVNKKDSSSCGLRSEDAKIKQEHKLKFAGNIRTNGGKCCTEIRRRIWNRERCFLKGKENVKNKDFFTEKKHKKTVNVVPFITYRNEC